MVARTAPAVADGSLLVWVCRDPESAGAWSARQPGPGPQAQRTAPRRPHQAGRAPCRRGRGLARALLATAESAARASGVTLLMLDTVTGSRAEHVYLAMADALRHRPRLRRRPGRHPGGFYSFFYKRLTAAGG